MDESDEEEDSPEVREEKMRNLVAPLPAEEWGRKPHSGVKTGILLTLFTFFLQTRPPTKLLKSSHTPRLGRSPNFITLFKTTNSFTFTG